jgi:hypothetical protein
MSFLKPKTISAPAVAEDEPAPTELAGAVPEEIKQQEARKRRRRKGRRTTVVTGGLAPEAVGKKRLLG